MGPFDYSAPDLLAFRRSFFDKFSTRQVPWNSWLLERVSTKLQNIQVLDIGGASGSIWNESHAFARSVLLSDKSSSMLPPPGSSSCNLAVIAAERLAVKSSVFDLVTAFNVLYHLTTQSRRCAFREVVRALKSTGVFAFTTIGESHLKEIRTLAAGIRQSDLPVVALDFPLNQAESIATEFFESVSIEVFPDALEIDDPASIVRYILTTPFGQSLNPQEVLDLTRATRERCTRGPLQVKTEVGLLICKTPVKECVRPKRRESKADCPFCTESPDSNEYWIKVEDFKFSKLCLTRDQTYRGQCLLIFVGRHVESLEELNDCECNGLLSELRRSMRAIRSLFNPDHMNVELLGNVEPHLHFHIIPRYMNDPRWGRPIWLTEPSEGAKSYLKESEYSEVIRQLRVNLTPGDF